MGGTYRDPDAGKQRFEPYAKAWLEAQTFDESTREAVGLRLRLRALPVLGHKELRLLKPSTMQAWLRSLERLAPSYQRVIYVNVVDPYDRRSKAGGDAGGADLPLAFPAS